MDSFDAEEIRNSDYYKELEAFKKEAIEESETIYARLKDNPSVKKLFEIGGVCSNTTRVMEEIERIEQLINGGMSYSDAFKQFAYSDDFTGNLALLEIAERQCNTSIVNAEQWHDLAKIDLDDMEWIKSSFTMALEARYSMALDKILRDGGKYKDLIETNPADFGLPDEWEGMVNNPMTKAKLISQSLFFYIEDYTLLIIEEVTLDDLVDHLEAPHKVIRETVQYYNV